MEKEKAQVVMDGNIFKTKGDFKMNKEAKLLKLKARAVHIKSRGRYLESPGVLKKVNRQIATLEKESA